MGGHNCLYYDSLGDLCGVVASFLREGIRKNMLCVWVIPEGLEIEAAKTALRERIEDLDKHIGTGQLEIREFSEWYFPSGEFKPEESLKAWAQKESQALELGFSALCAIGDGSGFLTGNREKLIAYESAAAKAISQSNISALCTYATEKFTQAWRQSISRYHDATLSNLQGMLTISN